MRSLVYITTVICLVSAIAVVGIRHENRISFIELQTLYEERDDLNIEWRRLLLERAALSRYKQLESWAQTNLDMQKPETQFVLPISNGSQYTVTSE